MISIFTPTHNPSFLPRSFEALKAQTLQNWEWVILYNNGAKPIGFSDPRVKEFSADLPALVGTLKAEACARASGGIFLELDHDDFLLPTALEKTANAFLDPEVGFVYSNSVFANGDLEPIRRFHPKYGWQYRVVKVEGRELDEHVSFPPAPDAISKIWFAPNHLRAFRRSTYAAVGGYDKTMRVLDDGDLMCRLYAHTRFHHIDEGLYVYRVHGENSWLRYNKEIQANVFLLHDKYAMQLAGTWADRNALEKIDLGSRINRQPGYVGVDRQDADVCCDLEQTWPFDDSSVGVVRAHDVFEHLRDPLHTIKELYRVLAPGGWAFIQVPSTDGRGAFQDPTHTSFWNENSFDYYTKATMARYIGTPVRFQASRLYTTPLNKDRICWTIAHLVSLKNGYRPAGLIEV